MITRSKPIRSLVQDKTDHLKCLLLEQQITGLVSSTSLTGDAHSQLTLRLYNVMETAFQQQRALQIHPYTTQYQQFVHLYN